MNKRPSFGTFNDIFTVGVDAYCKIKNKVDTNESDGNKSENKNDKNSNHHCAMVPDITYTRSWPTVKIVHSIVIEASVM